MRMDKYGRELDLILILTENASYTAQQIADRLGITRRNRKRIRDAALYTFVYHYTFAAKSKSLII